MNDNKKFIEELDSYLTSDISPEVKVTTGVEPPNYYVAEDKRSPGSVDVASPTQKSSNKRQRATIVGDECEIEIPEGWRRQVVQRQGGLSAGKYDVYYYSPLGKKLRSRKEVQSHCELNNLQCDLELFRFTRVSNQNVLKGKRKSATQTTTPPATPTPSTPKTPKVPKSQKIVKPKPKISPTKLLNKDSAKKNSKLKPEKRKTPFKVSSDSFIKKRKKAVWVPPKSPYNLFQEALFQNPWKLLVGTMIINRTAGDEGIGNSLLWDFFKRWTSPETTTKSDWREIADFLSALTTSEKVAKMIQKFSEEYMEKKWIYPKELHGIGKYGNDSYRIFCVNEWKKVKPTDYLLTFYVDWLWDNHTVLGLD